MFTGTKAPPPSAYRGGGGGINEEAPSGDNGRQLLFSVYSPHVLCVLTACLPRVHRYYSATIIRMSGVKSDEAAIWLSAVTAAVNFLFTMVGLYLVERIGRRPLTLGSLMGEAQFFFFFFFCLPLFMGVKIPFRGRQITFVTVFNSSCHGGCHIPSLRLDLLCAVFSCVQTEVLLPMLGIFNVLTDVNTRNCTRGLCKHCYSVH